MESLKVTVKGLAPLLMHNGHLADPRNPHARALREAVNASKKNKTDAAFDAMAKAEFLGSLYVGEDGALCIPGEMIEATIINGAKKSKQGKQATAAICVFNNAPLQYKGPKDPLKLWETGNFHKTIGVRVGTNRVMRTRPLFVDWSLSFVVQYNADLLNKKDVVMAITKAGAEVGLAEWRPRYGRFEVVEVA